MRAMRRTIVLALFVLTPLAAIAKELPIRLEQPANGTILIGGSTAVIRWSAAGELDPTIEEWEGFLSVDGGRYYGARVTPHLDVSIREFRWRVPNVSSRDARLLLRFGDEREEHEIELPLSLTIQASAASDAAMVVRVTGAGESARPGNPAVAEWAEGDRDGAHLHLVAGSVPGMIGRVTRASGVQHLRTSSRTVPVEHRPDAGVRIMQRRSVAVTLALHAHADILLQSHRLNI